MHHFRTATPENLHGKTVLLRCAPNAKRIAQTLAFFGPCHAKWVVLTERGQPNGRYIPELSTEALAEGVQACLADEKSAFSGVQFIPDTLGRMAQAAVRSKPVGSVTVLENVGFLKEHASSMDVFGAQMAQLALHENCVAVIDDFAACHQGVGSILGVQKHMPAYIGPEIAEKIKEIEALKQEKAQHHVVLAGANVAQNLELLEHVLPYTALVAAEGPTAHTLMAAKDMPIGKSAFDATQIARARNVLVEAGILGCRVLLPVDTRTENGSCTPLAELAENGRIGPVGDKTLNLWQKGFEQARSVLWRGLLTGEGRESNPNKLLARALQAHKLTPALMRPKQVAFYETQDTLPYKNLSEDAVFTLLTGRLPLGLRGLVVEQEKLAL